MERLKKIIIAMAVMCLAIASPLSNLQVQSPINTTITAEAAAKTKISKTSVSITAGKKYTLKVTGTKKKVTWSSSKKSVATVSSKGVVTAKKKGTATITAKVSGKKYTCKVTVKAKPKKVKIAIAKDTTGNTGSVISMLNRCGNVSYKIVGSSCNVNDYDGLVLPGGVDISPSLYGQKNKASKNVNKSLDKLQYKLLDKFVKAKKPVLGLCRGMQLINVYFGGTLKQDIKGHRGVTHTTTITSNSWIYQVYKKKSMKVNSWHHQSVQQLGKNLIVTQRAKKGNVVEALEHKTLPVYGVQYHPEIMSNGKQLFQAFLKICRK